MKRNKSLRIACILMALVLATTLGLVGTLARYVDTIEGVTATVRAGLFRVTSDNEIGEFTFGGTLFVDDSEDYDEIVDEELAVRIDEDDDRLVEDDEADGIIVPGTVIGTAGYIAVVNDSEVAVYVELCIVTLLDDEFFLFGDEDSLFEDFLELSFRDEDGEMMPWLSVEDFIDLLEDDEDARAAIVLVDGDVEGFIPALAGAAAPAQVTLNLYARWAFGEYDDVDGWDVDIDERDTELGLDAACFLLGCNCVDEDGEPDPCEAELPTFEINIPLRAVQVEPA